MSIDGYFLIFGSYFAICFCFLILWIMVGIMAAVLKNVASRIFKDISPVDLFETEEYLKLGLIALIIVGVDIILCRSCFKIKLL